MISTFTAEQADAAVEQLASLLIDAVDNGASLGFLPPLNIEDAQLERGLALVEESLVAAGATR